MLGIFHHSKPSRYAAADSRDNSNGYTLLGRRHLHNQADDQEKSAQIPLMRDIYHLALSVVVWLGKATEESDRVLRFIDHLTRRPLNNLIHDRYKKIADRDTEPKNHGQQRRPLWQTVRSESERLLLVGLCNGALPLARGLQIGLDVSLNALLCNLSVCPLFFLVLYNLKSVR
jgi:hypothetical protein